MLWTGFSLRLSLYFGALSLCSTPASPSVPDAEKQPHRMRLLPAHFTFGMVVKDHKCYSMFDLNSRPD